MSTSIWFQSLRRVAKNVVPHASRLTFRHAVRAGQAALYRGTAVECPCCCGRFRRFLRYGVERRQAAQCPRCGALERHRLLWLFLTRELGLGTRPLRLLHIAPEESFVQGFATLPRLDYVSGDLDSPVARQRIDVTDIPFPDADFDAILCNHVLEHVPDDALAMRELRRVLRPGGWSILQVPLDSARATTYENSAITSPRARLRHFGQADHVRIYGCDYLGRLEAAGFAVEQHAYAACFGKDERRRYGLVDEEIYLCRRA